MTRQAATDFAWHSIREDARRHSEHEPILASFYHAAVLSHRSLEEALAYVLAGLFEGGALPAMLIQQVITEMLAEEPAIGAAIRADIEAWLDRDPACDSRLMPLLYFKGFHALETHRVVNRLWQQQRRWLAWSLHNRVASVCDVDIHPGAHFGSGIMIDHATGLVAGETTVVGDCVSILHSVTLGGVGIGKGPRHPIIERGVLISAGAKVLGPVRVGEGAKIGAGSVVLRDVAAHSSVAGVPAKVIGTPSSELPAIDMT